MLGIDPKTELYPMRAHLYDTHGNTDDGDVVENTFQLAGWLYFLGKNAIRRNQEFAIKNREGDLFIHVRDGELLTPEHTESFKKQLFRGTPLWPQEDE